MQAVCGSGRGTVEDTSRAVADAVTMAREQLHGQEPALAFLFVSASRNLAVALDAAATSLAGTDVVACTTFGELTEHGAMSGGVSCFMIARSEAEHRVVFAPERYADAVPLCDALFADLDEQIHKTSARGLGSSTSLLFGDGLSPLLEQVVTRARKRSPAGHAIVGAGAAADGVEDVTRVGVQGRAVAGASVAVHVFSRRRWGVGAGHGVSAASPRMTVTRAAGNVVFEIDGRPAFDVYREHVAAPPGVDISRLPILAQNELGVYLFDDLVRVRAPLSVSADGAMSCAGEVPEGSTISVVRGDPDAMIAAARAAAEDALAGLDGGPAAGVLVFSCMCRGLCLGDRYEEEVAAIRGVFPDTPIAGFLSYGEIALTQSRLDGYHNNTVVVVAIPR